MDLKCTLDTRNLSQAQAILMRYSKNVPAQSINKTALFVIRDAQARTPVVSQGRINTDMNVVTSPAVLNSGKLSKDKKKQNDVVTFLNRTPTVEDVSAINTAQRIVLARMHPGSRFNIETGSRWALTPPDVGRGRQRASDSGTLFWAWVKQAAERMVRSRHSSTGFLKHSWTSILDQLLPHVPTRFRAGFTMPERDLHAGLNSGTVVPAQPGSSVCRCVVSNTLGMAPATAALGFKYNAAIHTILQPILQSSIDREFQTKMEYAAKQGWIDESAALKVLGINVS